MANARNLNLGNSDLTTPAVRVEPARLSNTDDLPRAYKSLWANSSGVVRAIPIENEDTAAISIQVVAGTPVPFAVRRIFTTGTTADVLGVLA